MRVFVTGTGRCGTSTFYQACKHITNYTAGHESAAGVLESYPYPDRHIEVAGHLSMSMGRIIEAYPGAKWVHLIRERPACVDSLASQAQVQLDSFARHWMQAFQRNPREIAGAFYDCINANIRAMLLPFPSMKLRLEEAASSWMEFWRWIGAEGDFSASVSEWGRKYNPRENRGRDAWV